MMKIVRMFRSCGPGRTHPTGTVTILERESGDLLLVYVPDLGAREELPIKVYEVVPPPNPASIPEAKRGTTTGRIEVPGRSWHFFRELPVTGNRVVQTVAVLSTGPKVRAS